MLRLLKRERDGSAGKPLTMKEQEALCKKDPMQNVGEIVDRKADPRAAEFKNHPGLRPPGGDKKQEKKSGAKTK